MAESFVLPVLIYMTAPANFIFTICLTLILAGCQVIPRPNYRSTPEYSADDVGLYDLYNSGDSEELQDLLFADKWLLLQLKQGIIELGEPNTQLLLNRIALIECMIRNLRITQ